jgi:hypothetical protein
VTVPLASSALPGGHLSPKADTTTHPAWPSEPSGEPGRAAAAQRTTPGAPGAPKYLSWAPVAHDEPSPTPEGA